MKTITARTGKALWCFTASGRCRSLPINREVKKSMKRMLSAPFDLGGTDAGVSAPGGTVREMTCEAKVENIPAVTDFVNAVLEEAGCPMKAQIQIDMAIDELFANIAQYAYAPGAGQATVRVTVDPEAKMASVTFVDSGAPFDPLAKPDPNVSLPAQERAIGGLGIYLVKQTMDAVDYAYTDGRNELTIQKRIG